ASQRAKDLRAIIGSLFPPVPCPALNEMAALDEIHSDTRAIAEDLTGLKWTELSDELIWLNHCNLSLLYPDPFARAVPAFLLYPIQDVPKPGNESVARWTATTLCRSTKYFREPKHLSGFTAEQRKVLADWICFILENDKWYECIDEDLTE